MLNPAADAVMVTFTAATVRVVVTLKVAELCPCVTVTKPGTDANAELLDKVTLVDWVDGAVSVTVPCALFPPVTGLGETVTAESAGATSGVTVNEAVCFNPR